MKLHNKDFDEIFEVITFGYINSEVPNGNGDYPVEFVTLEVVDEEGDLYEFHYKSLKDLNVIWEDCTQKEPLQAHLCRHQQEIRAFSYPYQALYVP